MCGRIGRERKRESAVRKRRIALSNSMPGAICEEALGVFRLGEKINRERETTRSRKAYTSSSRPHTLAT